MENSKIEWTDHTANFWWGCFKVSPGCKNCYAETLSNRYGKAIWGTPETTHRELKIGIWKELPKWNEHARQEGKRRRVFVQSMADFFEDHPDVIQWREDALGLISKCEWLDFQILTKRPENVNRMIADIYGDCEWLMENLGKSKLPNIWIGTSVENQEMADKRIPELLNIPAHVRFLSVEPLLEEIDLQRWFHGMGVTLSLRPIHVTPFIHWVIVGGESGTKKRPFDVAWARSIRDECRAAGVPFFMKQIDKIQPIPNDLLIRQFPKEVTHA